MQLTMVSGSPNLASVEAKIVKTSSTPITENERMTYRDRDSRTSDILSKK